jgi:HAD superfamily hydrolase (TIGR01509 family)
MAIRAVLLDIDGTLVDSNYLHVDAWSRAFVDVGHPVDTWKIHRSIGMDGDMLLDALIEDADASTRKLASEQHSKHYTTTIDRLRAFHGARELLRVLASHDITVVLATSAPERELKTLRSVLSIEDAVAVVTSSEDVTSAKPSPDIVRVALDRARVEPTEAIMVGDSVWDMKAAKRAGVTCMGLLSGGIAKGELQAAGAAAVYRDPADLLENVRRSLLEH